jgi:putative hydroxymethylpyrimidine transport system substrate-binding protein
MTRPRSLAAVLTALVAAVALAACGEKSEPAPGAPKGELEPFTVMLDYFPNADHAGLYAAQAAGEYEKAGLDVKIQAPPDPAAPLRLLQAGRADVAISYEPELMLARDKGADLVSVGALVQKPLTSIMSIPGSGVRRVQDLRGKRVGTSGIPYQSAYLKTILGKAGVDPATVKETNVGFNLVPAMLSKRVDATLGAFWNYEGTDLRLRRKNPVIMRMEKLGVPTYAELVFAVRRRSLDEVGASRVRRFVQATARGHRALQGDPAAGVDPLMKANPDLDRKLQTAAVKATLPVFFPGGERPFGWQDPARWRAYGEWMAQNKLLRGRQNGARALTNEFLPGEGLDPGVTDGPGS